jgi:hypothetical protein
MVGPVTKLILPHSEKLVQQWCNQEFFSGRVYTQEFFSEEVQQIQLRIESRENGDLGVVAP